MPGAWRYPVNAEQRQEWLAQGNPEPLPMKFAGKGLGVDEERGACHASGRPCARVGGGPAARVGE